MNCRGIKAPVGKYKAKAKRRGPRTGAVEMLGGFQRFSGGQVVCSVDKPPEKRMDDRTNEHPWIPDEE